MFKRNKENRGPGESKVPTGTEIRVTGGNQESLRLPHGLVVTAGHQIARPTNPDQGSGRPFRTISCLLCGTWCVSEPALAGVRGRGPLGNGKY